MVLSGRVRVIAAAVVVLVLVALAAVYVVRRLDRSPMEKALDLVPSASLRVGFTDWKLVRERLKPVGLSTDKGIDDFMSRGYDSDLTAASSIDESAVALHDRYGFSPVNADWEAYAQSRQGAAMLLQLPGGTDMGAIEDRLDKLGYQRPSSGTGVWDGGIDLVAGIDSTISPELQYVVVDAGHHRIISSDTHAYAATAGQVSTGKADGLGSKVGGLLGHTPDPAAAYVWSGDFACEDLAMTSAASDDQAEAGRLVDRAGGVDPLSGLLMTIGPDRTLGVVLGFENSRQATDNLRPRADLYVGPAVTREGSYADDLRLTRSRTDGSNIVLTLEPRTRTGFALSAIDSGPLLFATC